MGLKVTQNCERNSPSYLILLQGQELLLNAWQRGNFKEKKVAGNSLTN